MLFDMLIFTLSCLLQQRYAMRAAFAAGYFRYELRLRRYAAPYVLLLSRDGMSACLRYHRAARQRHADDATMIIAAMRAAATHTPRACFTMDKDMRAAAHMPLRIRLIKCYAAAYAYAVIVAAQHASLYI